MKPELLNLHHSDWGWKQSVPYSQAVVGGEYIFIGGQQSLDSAGQVLGKNNIAIQTRNVFENLKKVLETAGLEMKDLVRLNTYYVFDGDDSDATSFWEDMTRIRLEYFPDPGPAATAVRVKGMPYPDQLIQIEAIALNRKEQHSRQRIMPAESWDWSISVPLSQGWRIGQKIFVGGQISADAVGATVFPGDVKKQTRNIYNFIRNVVEDAGGNMGDVAHIKICFKHEKGSNIANEGLSLILEETSSIFSENKGLVVSPFGVDLLYPGLVLEIDAMAVIDEERRAITLENDGGRYLSSTFADGICVDGEIYTGGQVAITEDCSVIGQNNIGEQARIVFGRLQSIVEQSGATLDDAVKLNIFLVGESNVEDDFHRVTKIWKEVAPNALPALTAVHVHELALPGLLIQADLIAVK